MHEACFVADMLGKLGEKGDDVVMDLALDLVDAGNAVGRIGLVAICPYCLGGLLVIYA